LKNSRKDGILVLKTLKPYKMAIDGQEVERNIIICHDITYQAENVAFDIEQYVKVAMMNIPAKDTTSSEGDNSEVEEFYKNESPTEQEVESQAGMFETLISMNSVVEMSKIMKKFHELIAYRRIKAEGNTAMTEPIWKTVHRIDKVRILCSYIAFFVNPLQRLSEMYIDTVKNTMQGDSKKTLMQSGLQ